MTTIDYETQLRIGLGWQCTECYGVRITTLPRQPHDDYRYCCEECGVQWSVPAHCEPPCELGRARDAGWEG